MCIRDRYRHFIFGQTNTIGCDLCLRRDRLNSGGKSTSRKNRSDKKLASIKNWCLWNGIDDILAHRSPCVLSTYDFYFSNRRGQEYNQISHLFTLDRNAFIRSDRPQSLVNRRCRSSDDVHVLSGVSRPAEEK